MNTLSLKILDKEMKVACPPEQADSLTEAARLLDNRMRELRDQNKVVGSERIAVMAALQLAHDLLQQNQQAANPPISAEQLERLQRMRGKIEACLVSPAS